MNKNKFLIALSLLSLTVVSCKEDYFDEEGYRKLVQQSFPVQDVDPQQTWTTVGTASVTLSLNLNAGEDYSLKIYDENPIGSPSGMKLLGQGTAKGGQTFTTTISYPLDIDFVFVAVFDKNRYMTVYPVGINNGKIEAQIGSDKQTSAARSWVPMKQKSHDMTFPDAPDASNFKTAVPEGALSPNEYWRTRTGNYRVSTSDTQLNFYEGNCNVYFPSGTYRLSSFAINNNTNIYLLPGATVEGSFAFKYSKVNFYIAEGATLKGDINATVNFYNKGTIDATNITLYGTSNKWWSDPDPKQGFIYNEGTVLASGTYHIDDLCQSVNADSISAGTFTVDEEAQMLNKGALQVAGELGVKNNESLFINEGRTTAGSVGVEGSADFYNDGLINVSGTTTVNSNQCTWHNDGTYITRDYTYQAGSTDVINNCKLIVTNRFFIGLGDTDQNRFRLNAGGSVVTKDFEFSGPGFIDMGAGSLIQVTDKAYMAITKDRYGIYGPSTGGYAVFQAKEIVRRSDVNANQGFVANYFGHLYVATDKHFNFGYSDKSAAQQAAGEVGSQPYYRLDAASGARMTGYNGADVHVQDNGCGAAYDGEPVKEEPQATTFSLRYCFEDNFPEVGDYDFNDVVLTLTPTIQGRNVTLKVTLDAVGAQENVGAAIRIKDLKNADIESFSRQGNFDEDFPQVVTKIIPTSEERVPDNLKYNGLTDVVLNLFSSAHWTMARAARQQGKTDSEYLPTGSVRNWFYNTVERHNAYEMKVNDVTPPSVTYSFTLKSEEAAAKFCESCLDVFIVEEYNGGFWEVHTVPFKTQDVLAPYAGDKSMYADNFPWAICVPGDFRYPIEWQPIGSSVSIQVVAYDKFGLWAKDRTSSKDWYKYPTAGLVY